MCFKSTVDPLHTCILHSSTAARSCFEHPKKADTLRKSRHITAGPPDFYATNTAKCSCAVNFCCVDEVVRYQLTNCRTANGPAPRPPRGVPRSKGKEHPAELHSGYVHTGVTTTRSSVAGESHLGTIRKRSAQPRCKECCRGAVRVATTGR